LRNAGGVSFLDHDSYINFALPFMPRVILFKTQSQANGTDTYQDTFAQAGFEVQYIPVLQETFHLDELSHLISDQDKGWGGVIITSKRGAEGWIQAAQRCEDNPFSTSKSYHNLGSGTLSNK
jgi:uroporphyrinogen-III synthase